MFPALVATRKSWLLFFGQHILQTGRLAAGGLEVAFAYFVILLFCYFFLYCAFVVSPSFVSFALFGVREQKI